MVKKINPWDNGGDEDGWSLGGEMFKKNKIVDFSKIRSIVRSDKCSSTFNTKYIGFIRIYKFKNR